MRTTFTRVIEASVAVGLINEIISTAKFAVERGMSEKEACPCEGASCPCRWIASRVDDDGSLIIDNDCFDNRIIVTSRDGVTVKGITCGGWHHTLHINEEGACTVIHDGARSSEPTSMIEFLPSVWQDLNNIKDWELVSYETSEKDWSAIAGLLRGKVGNGPTNLQEEREAIAKRLLTDLKGKARKVGFTLPEGIFASTDVNGKVFLTMDGEVPYRPAWDGIHYRRAAANGVSL